MDTIAPPIPFDYSKVDLAAPLDAVPKVESDGWVAPSLESLDIYYEEKKDGTGVFWHRVGEVYAAANEKNLRRHLRTRGIIGGKRESTQFERIAELVLSGARVQAAGSLAGHKPGLLDANGKKMLVVDGPKLITPKQGSWDVLRGLIEGGLGHADGGKQLATFYSSLKISYEAMLSGIHHFGQAQVFVGPVGCGKSLLQTVITAVLGGRQADPWPHMQGRTQFNYDFIGAEHLCFGDEVGELDPKSRRALAGKVKSLVVNMAQRIEEKGKTAFVARPCARLSMSLNDEPEDMAACPAIGKGTADKIHLFLFTRPSLFNTPLWREKNNEERWALLMADLPGFLHWLKEEFVIPEELKTDERMGVGSYHNPDLLQLLRTISPEDQLLELIDEHVFAPADNGYVQPLIDGSANQHVQRLAASIGYSDRRLEKLLTWHGSAGSYLNKLSGSSPGRVRRHTVRGKHLYKISRPGLDVRTL